MEAEILGGQGKEEASDEGNAGLARREVSRSTGLLESEASVTSDYSRQLSYQMYVHRGLS